MIEQKYEKIEGCELSRTSLKVTSHLCGCPLGKKFICPPISMKCQQTLYQKKALINKINIVYKIKISNFFLEVSGASKV